MTPTMTLTSKYALFRKNRPTTGRLIELVFILIAFSSIAALLAAENLHLTLTALVIALSCFAVFFFFSAAEKIRHSLNNEQGESMLKTQKHHHA